MNECVEPGSISTKASKSLKGILLVMTSRAAIDSSLDNAYTLACAYVCKFELWILDLLTPPPTGCPFPLHLQNPIPTSLALVFCTVGSDVANPIFFFFLGNL